MSKYERLHGSKWVFIIILMAFRGITEVGRILIGGLSELERKVLVKNEQLGNTQIHGYF